jgi:hypothetical protein
MIFKFVFFFILIWVVYSNWFPMVTLNPKPKPKPKSLK